MCLLMGEIILLARIYEYDQEEFSDEVSDPN
jgi:hypothetical protein